MVMVRLVMVARLLLPRSARRRPRRLLSRVRSRTRLMKMALASIERAEGTEYAAGRLCE